MAGEGKKRIVKDYDALPEEIVNQVKLSYPYGFADNLITYLNKDGKKVSALPFETDEIYYLIRMSQIEAERIIEEDDDYDDDGNLKDEFTESFDGIDSDEGESSDEVVRKPKRTEEEEDIEDDEEDEDGDDNYY